MTFFASVSLISRLTQFFGRNPTRHLDPSAAKREIFGDRGRRTGDGECRTGILAVLRTTLKSGLICWETMPEVKFWQTDYLQTTLGLLLINY